MRERPRFSGSKTDTTGDFSMAVGRICLWKDPNNRSFREGEALQLKFTSLLKSWGDFTHFALSIRD